MVVLVATLVNGEQVSTWLRHDDFHHTQQTQPGCCCGGGGALPVTDKHAVARA